MSAAEIQKVRERSRGRIARRELLLLFIIATGLGLSAVLSRWLEARHANAGAQQTEELYVKPAAARRMSLGFNGLVADWYWLRSLQYVGRRMLAYQGNLQMDDLSPVGLTQLAPLLDSATTLDPQFIPAYEYGAIVLPAIDTEA